LEINRNATAKAVYDRFSETHRFDALSCRRDEERGYEPHIFWDSDVAKWIEGAAYILAERRDEQLEELCDKAISDILSNQAEDGYFNSYYLTVAPERRFTERDDHELYCAGHLIEASIAYAAETGKEEFLCGMRRYADLIYDVFLVKRGAAFETCGHPEIELALFRLADARGDEKYAELARFFLDARGNNEKDIPHPVWGASYSQSHLPLKEQTTAEGHAVRAGYIYSAMADAAARFDDGEYAEACEKLFENITERRMYITGGIGSTHIGEAFTVDYDLPNESGYLETCAAIALAHFARRMLRLKPDSRYADTVERVMYNGALSGVALDGRSFFYSNAVKIDPKLYAPGARDHLPSTGRAEVFYCSCCPPNILRFIASITEDFYTFDNDTLFVHQFAGSTAEIRGAVVTQNTDYPAGGRVALRVDGVFRRAAIRIPGWCADFNISEPYTVKDGYAYVDLPSSGEVVITFDMTPRLVESNGAVCDNVGRAAVVRGPVVYCMEGQDNGGALQSLFVPEGARFSEEHSEYGVPILRTKGYRRRSCDVLYAPLRSVFDDADLTFIPYFAYANRGEDEMALWANVFFK
ncbi:MAG: glycoside hydrolase family 127 protein, partial [Clostridia bacterium]|nr:glycoside hydrolase family 127 protein [Clostridia bacterium]